MELIEARQQRSVIALRQILLASLAALTLQGLAPGELSAKDEGSVTVKSRTSSKTVTGPTRSSPTGRQVRLPGGTWVDCGGDCREALRKQSVDFWEAQEEQARALPSLR